ncbi:hypothetical protein Tco_0935874 [Tanacetum coccineum]
MFLDTMMMLKNISSVNELPKDDHMVYDYLTRIVTHVICHKNKNNNVHKTSRRSHVPPKSSQSVAPSSRKPAHPETRNSKSVNNGSLKKRLVNPVRVGSSNTLVTTTKEVNLGPKTITVISITTTPDFPSRPINRQLPLANQPLDSEKFNQPMVKPNEVTNSNVNPAMLPSGSKILKHGHPPRLSNSSTPKQINQPTAAAKQSPLSIPDLTGMVVLLLEIKPLVIICWEVPVWYVKQEQLAGAVVCLKKVFGNVAVSEMLLQKAFENGAVKHYSNAKGFGIANFEKDMGGTIRGNDAIVSKWKNSILPKVAAFSVVYDGVQRMDENGSSDLVLFQNALAEYQTRYRHPFTMEACWRIWKNHPAWTTIEVPTYQDPAFKENLEEEAKAKKEQAIYDKELEEFLKAQQAHDELFRMECGVKSNSEYETD